MVIIKFKVRNFKCFHEETSFEFETGINIVSGQNNAGKTALLEALTIPRGSPHESQRSKPTDATPVPAFSRFEVWARLSPTELMELLIRPGFEFQLPIPEHTAFLGPGDKMPDELPQRLFAWFTSREQLVALAFSREASTQDLHATPAVADGEETFGYQPLGRGAVRYQILRELPILGAGADVFESARVDAGTQGGDYWGAKLASRLLTQIYRFGPERRVPAACPYNSEIRKLNSDGSNLPACLARLQANRKRFERKYLSELNYILPQVHQISVIPGNEGHRIDVWTHPPETEREALARPLDQCGTGIGQVLALLYVVVDSDTPQVILLDEPQSYLHPGAVRKLIDVFRRYPQHQYIISTHSAAVISASRPSTLTQLVSADSVTKPKRLDRDSVDDLRSCLSELGAELSDVFGADMALWVEGQTEYRAFPRILDKLSNGRTAGAVILPVRHTGDFEGKKTADQAIGVYSTLSRGRALLPPAVGFVFDMEGKRQSERDDLERKARSTGVSVRFLPRRLFENYLLDTEAITAVVGDLVEKATGTRFTEEQLENWLAKRGKNKAFFPDGGAVAYRDGHWIELVHGAAVLEGVVSEFAGAKAQYRKTEHSVELTQWLLDNKPAVLQPLADFLTDFIEKGLAAVKPVGAL